MAQAAKKKAPVKKAVVKKTAAQKSSTAPVAAPAVKLPSQSVTLPGSAVKVEMLQIPTGSITVTPPRGKGSPKTVEVKSIWMSRKEITWEAFDAFMSSGAPSPREAPDPGPDAVARPSRSYIAPDMGFGHRGYPVLSITQLTADMFCRWLTKETGRKFRLPTEAEWEYACRAGSAKVAKMTPAQLDKVAWYSVNCGSKTHPVGKKLANAWGFYDMLGNVAEWANTVDGKPVLCGGAYTDKAANVSPSSRAYPTPAWQSSEPVIPKSRWWLSDGPFAGFRIVCEN